MKQSILLITLLMISNTAIKASEKQALLNPGFSVCKQALIDHISSLNVRINNADQGIELFRRTMDSLPKNEDGTFVNPEDRSKFDLTAGVLESVFDLRSTLIEEIVGAGYKLSKFEDMLFGQTIKAVILKQLTEGSTNKSELEQINSTLEMLVKLQTPPTQ